MGVINNNIPPRSDFGYVWRKTQNCKNRSRVLQISPHKVFLACMFAKLWRCNPRVGLRRPPTICAHRFFPGRMRFFAGAGNLIKDCLISRSPGCGAFDVDLTLCNWEDAGSVAMELEKWIWLDGCKYREQWRLVLHSEEIACFSLFVVYLSSQ